MAALLANSRKDRMPEALQSTDSQLLTEHALGYLRECHSHAVVLTGTVVTLNTVTLVAGGAFLSFGAALTADLTLGASIALIVTGVLIAAFGVIFNVGASGVHKNLYETAAHLRLYILAQLGTSNNHDFFKFVVNVERGWVYRLTEWFLFVCGIIWVALGGVFVVAGIRSV